MWWCPSCKKYVQVDEEGDCCECQHICEYKGGVNEKGNKD